MLGVSILVLSLGCIQLASDPDADELLVNTLIEMEALDSKHCARCSGTLSGIQKDLPRIVDVYGVSAKNDNLEFHSYGSKGSSGKTQWFDALRDSKNRHNRFKSRTDGSETRSKDLLFETDSDGSKDKSMVWPWP